MNISHAPPGRLSMHCLIHAIAAILRVMTGLAFAVLMAVVLIQVVTRTFSDTGSPVWTEELTRFALLYVAAFGAGLSLWTGAMVNVDMLVEHLPGKLPWICRLLSALSVCFFAAMLIAPAWRFTKIGWIQTAASMPWLKMGYVNMTVLIMLALIAFTAGLRVIGMLTGSLDGHPEIREEEVS